MPAEPTIALAMGDRGVISRLLAPKYGGYLTFGALGSGKGSAPGQPTMTQLRSLFSLPTQTAATKVRVQPSQGGGSCLLKLSGVIEKGTGGEGW